MQKQIVKHLASALQARQNCLTSGNADWFGKHTDRIEAIVKNHLPSGSGFDSGTAIDIDASDGNKKIVFTTSFHHLNEAGYYDGWTEHKVIIRPGFESFQIDVTGRDRNGIKDYIAETFDNALTAEIDAQFDSLIR